MPHHTRAPRGASVPAAGNNLLARPGPDVSLMLEKAQRALAEAFPIPPGHLRDLPFAIRDLSRILTSERGDLARSYWSAPRYVAAYLYFFLPWNLYRLSWLLPGLDLPLRPGARILDLGSGPLTLPLALWCARPDLRRLPLSFDCVDVAIKPMEYGKAVFRQLTGNDSPWRITLKRLPVEKALRPSGRGHDAEAARPGYDCIMAGNVLNELCSTTARGAGVSLEKRLKDFTALACSSLAPGGRLFLLEPGTRLGGKLISLVRKGALEQGVEPLAPCTHHGPCPMLEGAMMPESARPARFMREDGPQGSSGQSYSGWCHFIHPAGQAPQALRDLSAKARLEKHSLALSCLLLRRQDHDASAGVRCRTTEDNDLGGPYDLDDLDALEALYAEIMAENEPEKAAPSAVRQREGAARAAVAAASGPVPVRVISGPIRLPGEDEAARYACCEKGLALMLGAAHTPSGGWVEAPLPSPLQRDRKTGALLLRVPVRGKKGA